MRKHDRNGNSFTTRYSFGRQAALIVAGVVAAWAYAAIGVPQVYAPLAQMVAVAPAPSPSPGKGGPLAPKLGTLPWYQRRAKASPVPHASAAH